MLSFIIKNTETRAPQRPGNNKPKCKFVWEIKNNLAVYTVDGHQETCLKNVLYDIKWPLPLRGTFYFKSKIYKTFR
jgi:hypothetical protein